MRKSNLTFIITLSTFFLLVISHFLFGEDVSNNRIILIHGLNSSSKDMQPMKDGLIKMGIPEKNIEVIDLPKNKGAIEKNARYVGNYIKDTYDGRKVTIVGYSMGGVR